MKKFLLYTLLVFVLLFILYIIGPKPASPILSESLPKVPSNLLFLNDSINMAESRLPVKLNNQARILWANDSNHQKTHIALVYLHGFTASQEEGNPLHSEFAKRYGCNLFLSRLAMHGLKDSDAYASLTADSLFNTAKMALKIGMQLGDSVILMATSAGGALALSLAAEEQNIPIKALILYSPCIQIFDPNSKILDKPWGLTLARQISKGKYLFGRQDSLSKKYWYSKFRIEGVIALQNFLDHAMIRENFEKVHVPVLCLAYYRDSIHHDSTVSVPAIKTMFSELGSKDKQLIILPNVGDHVLASYLRSKDLNAVRQASFHFAEKDLGLKRIN